MFSHIMVGSNDVDGQEILRLVLGKRPRSTTRAVLPTGTTGAVFMVTQADRRRAGDARERRDDRLQLRQPGRGRCLARRGRRGRRHLGRGPARLSRRRLRQALSCLSSRSGRQQALRASPSRHSERWRSSCENQVARRAAAGRQAMRRRDLDRHDLLDLPAAAGRRRRQAAGRLVSVGAHLHPRQCHRERRVSRRLRRAWPDLRRARTPARAATTFPTRRRL